VCLGPKRPVRGLLGSVCAEQTITNPNRPDPTLQSPTRHQQTLGWLRLVGSLKLLVSVAKEPYKTDYILQKRPMILGSLLIEDTPYEGLPGSVTVGLGICQGLLVSKRP